MNPFNDAVQNYLSRQGAQVSSALSNRESLDEAKQSMLQSKTATDIGIAGSNFADKLHEQGNKVALDLGLDMTAAGVAPTILKAAARVAMSRASSFPARANYRWKVVNARRQAIAEGQNPDSAAPEFEGTARGDISDFVSDAADSVKQKVGSLISEKVGGLQQTVESRVSGLTSEAQGKLGDFQQAAQSRVSGLKNSLSEYQQAGEDFAEQTQGKISGIASGFGDEEMLDPGFTQGLEIPEGAAGNATRIGQMLRSMGKMGIRGTSSQTAEAMNAALEAKAGPIQQSMGKAAGADFGPESLQMPRSLKSSVVKNQTFEEAPSGSEGMGVKPSTLDIQTPKITPDVPPPEVADIESGVKQFTQQASGIAEDLAPELTEATSMWSSVGSVLGDAIPFVGFGLGLFGLGETIKSAIDEAKEGDPYASVRGEIATAQTKLNNLSSNISADDFQSKIGAGFAASGSLAASQFNTAKQTGIALHV